MNNYLTALLACAAVAVFEGVCAGKDPLAKLATLKQPKWSPPAWLWVLIGMLWYGICFVAFVRLLPRYSDEPWPPRLLVILMTANAFANVPQFRMGRLDLAFLFFVPYWIVLAAFVSATAAIDFPTTVLFAVYSAYQAYAVAWGWQLWALNGRLAPWTARD